MKYHILFFLKMLENLSSAAVMIGALRGKLWWTFCLVEQNHLYNFGRELNGKNS